MRRLFGLALVGLALGSPAPGAGQTAAVDSLALARQYTQWLYEGAVDSLVANSSEGARQGFATPGGFQQYSDGISQMAGTEVSVIFETWKLRNGDCQYWRLAVFSDLDDLLLVRWIINPDGAIGGLGVGPNDQAPAVDRETCESGA